ncbi:macro domain-containing protein [Mucilaginibacter pedocola]|uniref:macro domain-containing protein n=1 Tax=Mucilaginibacter pedocola TaxID=1792845 RepID=UPI001EE49251|nr:macro domain-containing protein [Mucilaginibacter pedocola]
MNRQGGCRTGNAVITSGGNLPAKYVIHTVGPIYNGGKNVAKEEEQLANCYSNSLKLALANNIKTVAFPNISTGVYRFPKQRAAEIAVETVSDFLEGRAEIEEVVFICFDDENVDIYKGLLNS